MLRPPKVFGTRKMDSKGEVYAVVVLWRWCSKQKKMIKTKDIDKGGIIATFERSAVGGGQVGAKKLAEQLEKSFLTFLGTK